MKKILLTVAIIIGMASAGYCYGSYGSPYMHPIMNPIHPANPLNPISPMHRMVFHDDGPSRPYRHYNHGYYRRSHRCQYAMEVCLQFRGGNACINACDGLR